MAMPVNHIKALLFDVFGTLVDWRAGVAREAQSILTPRGYALDWNAFADAWREHYQPAMEEVRSGRIPYAKLDVLHRRMLQKILARFGLDGLGDAELDELTLAWHRLDAWPDVSAGLARLRERYLIAPVSNGNIAIMSDLARRNNLRWDAILGADLAGDYKPAPAVYLAAAEAFNLKPSECLMCAAHSWDLGPAAGNGLRTAFIARPEEQPGMAESAPQTPVDLVARNTLDLAVQLGA
jgi:2-haloacid dehalogenase